MQKSQKSWWRRAKDVPPKSPPSTKAHCTDQTHPLRPATRPGQLQLKILSCDRAAQGAHKDRDSRRSEQRETYVGLRQEFGLLYAVLPRRHPPSPPPSLAATVATAALATAMSTSAITPSIAATSFASASATSTKPATLASAALASAVKPAASAASAVAAAIAAAARAPTTATAILGDGVGLEGQDKVIGDVVGLEGQDKVIDIL